MPFPTQIWRRQIYPIHSFSTAAPSRETLPHSTDTDTQPDPRRAPLALLLPGETEGEGGLQKSSNSDALSQTLPSQLAADSEVPSAASVRWDSGEKRPWEGSGSGRTVRHRPVSSGILLSAGQRERGGSSARVRSGSLPPPAVAPLLPRSAAGLSQPRINPSGVPRALRCRGAHSYRSVLVPPAAGGCGAGELCPPPARLRPRGSYLHRSGLAPSPDAGCSPRRRSGAGDSCALSCSSLRRTSAWRGAATAGAAALPSPSAGHGGSKRHPRVSRGAAAGRRPAGRCRARR